MTEALLDTSVISGFVNAEMQPADAAAFKKMGQLAQRGLITIYASTVTREEIDAIPLAYRSSHLEEYESLTRIRAFKTEWIDTVAYPVGSGSVSLHPDYLALRNLLRDESDARLLFQAKTAGVQCFVTLDATTILNKVNEIATLAGLTVQSPSQYFSTTFKSA